jgi:hypothetical protein
LSSFAPLEHQPRALQNLEMLRDRGERHVEWRSEIADTAIAAGEHGNDCPSGGISESGEGAAERGLLIVNHMVKYVWPRPARQDRPE